MSLKNTKIDYKKELEAASKSMIMVHDPKLLIKLILRSIVKKVQIRYAGMITYDTVSKSYILNISRGETGVKIPAGFAKFDQDNPIIKLFTINEYKSLMNDRKAIVMDDLNKLIWQESVLGEGNGAKELLNNVSEQMRMYNAIVCVPAYYQNSLKAVLLLGDKKDESSFDQEELDFMSALASDVAMAISNAQLFSDLKKEAERNRELFIQTTIVLASTIEAKDKYTHGHTGRVTNYAMAIARQMVANKSTDFPPKFFENLYISAILHDIGKIGVPEAILNKTTKLTDEEFEIMKSHTLRGVDILKPLSVLKESMDGVKYHHERYDGKGYPEGLKGENIPIMAAIIAVADTFDAMTTDRPYRKGLSREKTLKEIKKNKGVQFNPKVVDAFVELYEHNKI